MDANGYGKTQDRAKDDNGASQRDPRPYLILLAVALVATGILLYIWKQERAAAFAELSATAEATSRQLAADLSDQLRPQAERALALAEAIDRADAEGASPEEIAALPRTLFDDEQMRDAWAVLESNAARARPPFGVWYERKDGKPERETGANLAENIMENEAYVALRERTSLRMRIAARTEMGDFSWIGGLRPEIKTISTLMADVPILRDGTFAGGAGFETDFPDLLESIDRASWSLRADVFLVAPDGTVQLCSTKTHSGGHYRNIRPRGYADALERCADATARGTRIEPFVTSLIHGKFLVVCEPVEAGDGGAPWFAASLYWLGGVSNAGMGWLLSVSIVWLVALLVAIGIHVRRNAKRNEAETAAAMPPLPPEQAEAFRSMDRKRATCIVLSALFFIPAIFFIRSSEKHYQEAKRAGDVAAAEKALAGMVPVVAVGVLVGCVLLYFHLRYR